MENKDYLERSYKTNFECGMKYCQQKNWTEGRKSLEAAAQALMKIIPLTYGAEKERYMANVKTLTELLPEVKNREAAGTPAPATPNAPSSTPKNSVANKPKANDAKGAGKKSADGVNYVVNGVNVKDFLSNESNDPVTFDDVKGMENEKTIIKREFFLSEEERAFQKYLGKKPKNFILLYGVPGTGKTFLAKAISEELKRRSSDNVPFFSIVGSQLSDCKVGATEKNIQAVFEFCKQFEKCVLFIDEFDTIAPDRKQANGDPTAASRVTVLLQMMDGFASAAGTLVIAATNCPYNLDGAVLSRANTRIEIPLPSYDVIYSVLQAKIADKLASDVDLAKLASRLERNGYSNRDIKNFIGNMMDSLSDEFAKSYELGQKKSFKDFCYTNAMIEKAFAEIVPTTKQSDIQRIEQFKQMGE